jgi:methylated-DNA-[protein]-cysteine S-methyltransferase
MENYPLWISRSGRPTRLMDMMLYTTYDSPIGELLLLSDGDALCGLYIQEGRTAMKLRPGWQADEEPFREVRAQLEEYFEGRRSTFDVPLAMSGSPFQLRVWRALQGIPYGETISYGEQARSIDCPSPRAVGAANGKNPISVIVPCHRVIGADASLTGYGGGLLRKRFLLDLEAGTPAIV